MLYQQKFRHQNHKEIATLYYILTFYFTKKLKSRLCVVKYLTLASHIMSNMSIEHTTVNGNHTIKISGDMTFDYQQMKKEVAGRYDSMFGDAKNLISKLKSPKLTSEQISDLTVNGKFSTFYDSNKIWGYFCVNPNDYSNYMFSPIDSENRDNNYSRMRNGVASFFNDGFDVYIINSN
jgi:hypothetical protein